MDSTSVWGRLVGPARMSRPLKYEAASLKYEAAGVGAGGGHDTSRHVPVRPFRPGGLPPPPITYIRQVHARIVAHGEKPTPALA